MAATPQAPVDQTLLEVVNQKKGSDFDKDFLTRESLTEWQLSQIGEFTYGTLVVSGRVADAASTGADPAEVPGWDASLTWTEEEEEKKVSIVVRFVARSLK